MSLTAQNTLRVVLYEGLNAQTMDDTERFSAMTALLEKGFAVTRTVLSGRVAPHNRGSMLVLGKFGAGRTPEAAHDTGNHAAVAFAETGTLPDSAPQ